MYYSTDDLKRDLPKLIGDKKVEYVLFLANYISISLYNEYSDDDTHDSIVIDIKDGSYYRISTDEECENLECTGIDNVNNDDIDYADLSDKFLSELPTECLTYNTRLDQYIRTTDTRLEEIVKATIIKEVLMEKTDFRGQNYETIKGIVETFIAKYKDIDDMGVSTGDYNIPLEGKIKMYKEYSHK